MKPDAATSLFLRRFDPLAALFVVGACGLEPEATTEAPFTPSTPVVAAAGPPATALWVQPIAGEPVASLPPLDVTEPCPPSDLNPQPDQAMLDR